MPALLGVAGVVLIGLLMLTSPVAATSPPVKASVTLKTPYSGTPFTFGLLDTAGCGSSFAMPTTPTFNATTGKATGILNVTAKSCAGANSTAVLGVDTGIQLNSTFKAKSTGTAKVTVVWTIDYAVYLVAKETKKGLLSSAVAQVGGGADLVVPATQASSSVSYNYSVFTNASHGTFTKYKYTLTYSASLNVTKGTVYAVEAYVDAEVVAEAGATGGSATATVILSGGSYEATLTSVTQP